MAETLIFSIPAPTANEDSAYRLTWLQSLDGETWSFSAGTILVSALTPDLDGKYTWVNSAADPYKYHTIRTETLDGAINVSSLVIPPRYAFQMTELYADVRDFELVPKDGIAFIVVPKTAVMQGIVINAAPVTKETDADGKLSVFVPQGSTYEITSTAFSGKTIKVRTSGRTFVNLSDNRAITS